MKSYGFILLARVARARVALSPTYPKLCLFFSWVKEESYFVNDLLEHGLVNR